MRAGRRLNAAKAATLFRNGFLCRINRLAPFEPDTGKDYHFTRRLVFRPASGADNPRRIFETQDVGHR